MIVLFLFLSSMYTINVLGIPQAPQFLLLAFLVVNHIVRGGRVEVASFQVIVSKYILLLVLGFQVFFLDIGSFSWKAYVGFLFGIVSAVLVQVFLKNKVKIEALLHGIRFLIVGFCSLALLQYCLWKETGLFLDVLEYLTGESQRVRGYKLGDFWLLRLLSAFHEPAQFATILGFWLAILSLFNRKNKIVELLGFVCLLMINSIAGFIFCVLIAWLKIEMFLSTKISKYRMYLARVVGLIVIMVVGLAAVSARGWGDASVIIKVVQPIKNILGMSWFELLIGQGFTEGMKYAFTAEHFVRGVGLGGVLAFLIPIFRPIVGGRIGVASAVPVFILLLGSMRVTMLAFWVLCSLWLFVVQHIVNQKENGTN